MTFDISIDRDAEAGMDEPHGIAITADDHIFTRLLRGDGNAIETRLLARPAQLAFWLVDNWWRLRWEGMPAEGSTPAWQLAHDLSGIGGGTIWPRLSMWGEGARVGLLARRDGVGVVGPVRFLEHGLYFITATDWESGVDRFHDEVQNTLSGFGSDRAALRKLVMALRNERGDRDIAAWRRFEARLGYDVDAAPDSLMNALFEFVEAYSAGGVEEAIQAAPGPDAARTLEREVEAARSSRLTCEFGSACNAAGPVRWNGKSPVWTPAEQAASNVRQAAGAAHGPLRNKALANILGASPTALASTNSAPAESLPYGLRLDGSKQGSQVVALRSRRSADRRFEIARALGDTIWARSDRLGPISRTKTDRQRFQRAFAQSLLCPFDELRSFVEDNGSHDEGIMAAAQYFHVNTKVIETTLVKKKVLPAGRFEDWMEAA